MRAGAVRCEEPGELEARGGMRRLSGEKDGIIYW